MGLNTEDSEENVRTNRRLFVESLGVAPGDVITGNLRHGAEVSVFRRALPEEWPVRRLPPRNGSKRADAVFTSDAVVSDVTGLHFFLTFADCVPLVLSDTKQDVVGAAHAGWRGTALGIGPATVRAMQASFGTDPQNLTVGIGPSIGPCCFVVGREVIDAFHANGFEPVVSRAGDELRVDLWATNEQQLVDAGVPRSAIENPRICTSCHTSTFFSHRKERGRTGRFALCVGLE